MNIFFKGLALLSLTFLLSFCATSKAPGSEYENTELGEYLKEKTEVSRQEIKAAVRYRSTSRELEKTFDSSTSDEDWQKGIELWDVSAKNDNISLFSWAEDTTDVKDGKGSKALFTVDGQEEFISAYVDITGPNSRTEIQNQPGSIGTKSLYYLAFKKNSAPGKIYYVELPPITLHVEPQPEHQP